ncbi:hypothetical protein NC651_020924 [Populus alba x Populus x berolinensis]|nr:hypothetical protein NC651_020924 [Populus alba x Populus x berolinensis]
MAILRSMNPALVKFCSIQEMKTMQSGQMGRQCLFITASCLL